MGDRVADHDGSSRRNRGSVLGDRSLLQRNVVSGCACAKDETAHTGISQADLDVAAHEAGLSLVKSLLQTLWRTKLDITETFRFAVNLVLHDAHSSHGAFG